MTTYSSQLGEEQARVDTMYTRLDHIRRTIRERLNNERATGSHGSPTQRGERNSFATWYEDRLIELRNVEDRLVFGRLEDSAGSRRYIGRIGLSNEQHDQLLVDWRSESARPFYEATPMNHGDIDLRRHITLRLRKVVAIEDEVLNVHSSVVQTANTQGTLTGEGALLAALDAKRTGKMGDIVATIQAEQDRIIRTPLQHILVVQGGPGTGKTAVALHRAAYLLYTHRRQLSRGVLVIGPNKSFLHYIDQVLPSLGESGVPCRTIGSLIPGMNITLHDNPYVSKLKGDKRMAATIAHAVHARERLVDKLPTLWISGVHLKVEQEDIRQAIDAARRTRKPHNVARKTFVDTVIFLLVDRYCEEYTQQVPADERAHVQRQLLLDSRLKTTLNLAWLPMNAQWLIEQLLTKPVQLARFAPWLDEEEIRQIIRPAGSPWTVEDIALLDEAMELLGSDPHDVERKQASERIHSDYMLANTQLAKDKLRELGMPADGMLMRQLVNQLDTDDHASVSELSSTDRRWTFGHIVVDEAQELTPMQWRMLARRCPSRSFTIVGDLAQTTSLTDAESWQQALAPLGNIGTLHIEPLTINYRNPREVSQLANTLAKQVGLPVSTRDEVRSLPGSIEYYRPHAKEQALAQAVTTLRKYIKRYTDAEGNGRIAIIAPAELLPSLETSCSSVFDDLVSSTQGTKQREQCETEIRARDFAANMDPSPSYDRQVSILTAQDCKGLEYDAVILVEPGHIRNLAPSIKSGGADLYVAMTRPTQRLCLIQTDQDAKLLDLNGVLTEKH